MSHLYTTRTPMTEARRHHLYGPLVSLDRPEGEPSLLAGTAMLFALVVVATMLIVAVG